MAVLAWKQPILLWRKDYDWTEERLAMECALLVSPGGLFTGLLHLRNAVPLVQSVYRASDLVNVAVRVYDDLHGSRDDY